MLLPKSRDRDVRMFKPGSGVSVYSVSQRFQLASEVIAPYVVSGWRLAEGILYTPIYYSHRVHSKEYRLPLNPSNITAEAPPRPRFAAGKRYRHHSIESLSWFVSTLVVKSPIHRRSRIYQPPAAGKQHLYKLRTDCP